MANQARGAAQSTKDKERAANLKRQGVRRTTGRCAICYRIIELSRMHNHVATGCGGS